MVGTSYKRPSKINAVSVLVAVVLLAGLYSLIQFGPPYWRKWKVKEILSSSASQAFKRRRHPDEEILQKIKDDTVREIHAAGVDDPSVRVTIDINEQQATVAAEYHERINHPLVKKTTMLTFRPHSTAKGGALEE
jgi:hypothetical protein